MAPLVSVLMSCYNAEQHIDEAINSLLNQTYQNIEFIFVNDGSTDNTLAKIEAFNDDRIQILTHTNKGIVEALNNAIQYCTGKYIARMDADDISSLDRIEKQVAFMEGFNKVSACGGSINEFNENGFIKKTSRPTKHQDLLFYSLHRAPISNPSSMIRRSILIENELSYDPIYKYGQDVKLWSEILKVGLLANIPDVILEYRKSLDQVSTKHRAEQKSLAHKVRIDTYHFIQKEFSNFETVSSENQYHFYRFMARHDNSLNKMKKLSKITLSSVKPLKKLLLICSVIFK
ncbi:glycosyltransferase family 2 protein [Colwellia sp. E2M01]|uniref:glycosyltransferase family 2 protein n=1 Tax=Colwellia sp. E2M01 TaxID=2841561 RepID=UPI001C09BC09|nr:glycosyltransferase family 2 protein [Colwellia sp. E2M01]MBU2870990.1 glycosyltransferase [Colwellia sp. E2M01]